MILSVSRRTDIPNYYSDWFLNRIQAGWLYVRNPMNPHQVSKINLLREVVDGIVFWTKNPEPMLARLDELSAYPFYFQFTLTGYGTDVESGVPHKKERMIPVFQELSRKIGPERVIWRYDPILFNERYTPEYHLMAFGQIVEALRGYTEKCVVSFVDSYAKIKKSMDSLKTYELDMPALCGFAARLAGLAHGSGMEIATCAESADFGAYGIGHNCCIDRKLIERIGGRKLWLRKDANQRKECGCAESIDVGAYNTCRNGCKYCYANGNPAVVSRNCAQYDKDSPLLCGQVTEADRITERRVESAVCMR